MGRIMGGAEAIGGAAVFTGTVYLGTKVEAAHKTLEALSLQELANTSADVLYDVATFGLVTFLCLGVGMMIDGARRVIQ